MAVAVAVRRVRPDDGPALRALRLAALSDAPSAFGASYDAEAARSPAEWAERARLGSAGTELASFVAERSGEPDDGTLTERSGGPDDGTPTERSGGPVVGTPSEADRFVGLVTGVRTGPGTVVELAGMWTAPGVRGTGVGRSLVDAVTDWAAGAGAGTVELWVTRGNAVAERLYESVGFRRTGDHQPLPSDPCKDEVRMRLDLNAIRPGGDGRPGRPSAGGSTTGS